MNRLAVFVKQFGIMAVLVLLLAVNALFHERAIAQKPDGAAGSRLDRGNRENFHSV